MIDKIEAIICAGEGINPEELHTKERFLEFKDCRQIVMYFARGYTDLCLRKIGSFYGFNHSTVVHACRRIKNICDVDRQFRVKIEKYRRQIAGIIEKDGIGKIIFIADQLKKDMIEINRQAAELQTLIDRQSEQMSKISQKIEEKVEVTDCDTKFEKPFANHPVRSTAFDGYIQHNL